MMTNDPDEPSIGCWLCVAAYVGLYWMIVWFGVLLMYWI